MSAAPMLIPFRERRLSSFGGAGRSARRERPVQGVGPAEQGSRKVLVVEPNARLRAVLKVALAKAGFEVLSASDAQGAREVLFRDEAKVDLVVLEAGAADQGRSFCSEIRAEFSTAELPVLALCEDRALARAASAAGADECLAKPLHVRDVVSLAQLKAGSACGNRRFEADCDVLAPSDLLRALLSAHRAGRMDFGALGFLEFCSGRVVRSSFRGEEGEAALRRLMYFAEGRYEVRYGPVAEGSSQVTLREICRSAIPAVRRWEKMVRQALPMQAVLTADLARFLAVRKEIPVEAEALVRRFDGLRTVEQVVLSGAGDESVALATATRLYEMGVLVPVSRPKGPVDAMLDGLPESARRQLEAFKIRTVVEVQKPRLSLVAPLTIAPPPPPPARVELVRSAALTLPGEPAPMQVVVRSQKVEPGRAEALEQAAEVRRPVPGALVVGLFGVAVCATVAVASRTPRAEVARAPAVVTELRQADRYAEALSLYDAGRLDDARRALGEALAARPTNASAWTLLGLMRFDEKDLAGAEEAANKALALDPKQSRAQLLLANVALEQHETELARVALDRYLALEPTGPHAGDARALLQSLSAAR